MSVRAFPVVYARDVSASVGFYARLGFEVAYRHPPDGEPGYVGLRRGEAALGVVTVASPKELIGADLGEGPRFELFVYVEDVDATLADLRDSGVPVLREAHDMPWGERIAYVADPDRNPVVLAGRSGRTPG